MRLYFAIVVFLISIYKILGDEDIIFYKYLYKRQLRGMYEKEKNEWINKITNSVYKSIYSSILQKAKLRETEVKFIVLCSPQNECYQYPNVLVFDKYFDGDAGTLYRIYHITNELLIPKVINKLNTTFADCNIATTKSKTKPCCDYYTLSW